MRQASLGLNRLKTRKDLVQENELSPEMAEEIFLRVIPAQHREDGTALYLEALVDQAISDAVLKKNRHSVASRPTKRPKKSISNKRDDSDMWAKSVEKTKEPDDPLLVDPLLVSEEAAATMLGISPRSVWELGDKGILQYKRIGRRKLYLFNSLKAFAESGMEVK